MEKLILVCFNGIFRGILEEGRCIYSSVQYGFLGYPDKMQKEFVTKCFQKAIKEYKDKYDIAFVVSDVEKDNLKEAIKKIIVDNKEHYSNDDWKYWEHDLLRIDYPSFDKFNREVVELIV